MDRNAYLLTVCALLLWSTLAVGAAHLDERSSLVTVGLGLVIGGLVSAPRWRAWEVPLPARLVGVGGILCYHLLFFAAFQSSADDLTVTVLNYLWPLLMVVLAPCLVPNTTWSWRHLWAGLLGLAGTACAMGVNPGTWSSEHLGGYALAIAAAVVWALYSLTTKRLKPFSSLAVGGFCLVSGAIALGIAAAQGDLMPTLGSMTWVEVLIIVGLGIGPLGIAFICWDAALKRGDPRVIGALAYVTPPLSLTWMILSGRGEADWRFALALVLISVGAAVGSRPTPKRRT